MRTATYQLKDLEDLVFYMGYVGENEHRALRIDCSEAYEEYPNATPALSIAPPRGEPYPGMITEDGNYVLWVITDSDLAYDGSGEAQFSFVQDEVVMKTYRFKTKIDKSIIGSGTRPNPLEDFIVRADAVLEEVEHAVIEVTNKADKVTEATAGNFAGLDENGNLTDSGAKPSDYAHKSDTVLSNTLSMGRKENTTVGVSSTALGSSVEASGLRAFACGQSTKATNTSCHAEGIATEATGAGAHSEGTNTKATGDYSHSQNYYSKATGYASSASGYRTTASGQYSNTQGSNTTASGSASDANGICTTANHESQHAFGEYNVPDPSEAAATARGNYVEIVGNGTANNAQSNARSLDWNGNERLKGTLYVGCNADSSGGAEVATKYISESVSGATVSITGVDNHRYVCGTVTEISITPPQTGIIDVVFTAGSSCVLNLANTITMPEWFDPTDIEDGKRYEINIEDGYGVVMAWN